MKLNSLIADLQEAFEYGDALCWSIRSADGELKTAFVQRLRAAAEKSRKTALVEVDTHPDYLEFLRAVSRAILAAPEFGGELSSCETTEEKVRGAGEAETAQNQLRDLLMAVGEAEKAGAPRLCLVLDHFDNCGGWNDMSWMRGIMGGYVHASILLLESRLTEVSDHTDCNSPFYNIYRDKTLEE